jgi:hypothetical protein
MLSLCPHSLLCSPHFFARFAVAFTALDMATEQREKALRDADVDHVSQRLNTRADVARCPPSALSGHVRTLPSDGAPCMVRQWHGWQADGKLTRHEFMTLCLGLLWDKKLETLEKVCRPLTPLAENASDQAVANAVALLVPFGCSVDCLPAHARWCVR